MIKSKVIISTLLTAVLCLGTVINSYAEVVNDTYDVDSDASIEDKSVSVEYARSDSYTLIIPKTIILDGTVTNPTQNFTVTCKGDLSSGSSVKVTSDSNFNLVQEGKDSVLCNVGYDHTFDYDAITTEDGEVTNGSIVIPSDNGNALSAGSWTGAFNFYITYHPYVEIVIPSADEFTKIYNIASFIDTNNGTFQQIGFQGDGEGKFYVKAGSFSNDDNPNIISSGTLIYDAGSSAPSDDEVTNYKYGAHLANIMNYILYETLGSLYGFNTTLFPDTPTATASYICDTQFAYPYKGFNRVYGRSNEFGCQSQGYADKYGLSVSSYDYSAVWFGEPTVTTEQDLEPITASDIPSTDSCSLNDNIVIFINAFRNTSQQICFQSDGFGKFYVKAGSFTSDSSPGLDYKGGTLIYDVSPVLSSDSVVNYVYSAHLSNIMNYILYCTKGSEYGSSTAIFSDTPASGKDYTILSDLSKGFYYATGSKDDFFCGAKGYTSYYNDEYVRAMKNWAVWW